MHFSVKILTKSIQQKSYKFILDSAARTFGQPALLAGLKGFSITCYTSSSARYFECILFNKYVCYSEISNVLFVTFSTQRQEANFLVVSESWNKNSARKCSLGNGHMPNQR